MMTALRFPASLLLLGLNLGFIDLQLVDAQEEIGVESKELANRTKQARRDAMRRFVESFKVICSDEAQQEACQLVKDPVMYFSDPVYHPEIGEGTMWIWQRSGRPQVVAQVYTWGGKDRWTMGLYNFFSGPISFVEEDGKRIEYRGTDFRPIPISDAPAPAQSRARRGQQMKQIAKRFSASERRASWNDPKRPRHELRLLSQPIYRYHDDRLGIIDGAVYRFCSWWHQCADCHASGSSSRQTSEDLLDRRIWPAQRRSQSSAAGQALVLE